MNHTHRLQVSIADQRLCLKAELGVQPQISALQPWREAGVHCHRPSEIRVGGRWYRSIAKLLAMFDGDRPVASIPRRPPALPPARPRWRSVIGCRCR